MSITFDIETIPKQSPLTKTESAYFLQKLEREQTSDAVETQRKVKAINPWLGRIVCIGIFNSETKDSTALINGTEGDILNNFWNEICNENQFISFNGFGFDILWIIIRSICNNIPPIPHHPFLNRSRYRGNPHFDIAHFLGDGRFDFRPSLKLACEAFGIPSPKEGEVCANTVEKYFLSGDIELIAEYCLRDVQATYTLAKKTIHFLPNQITI